MMEERSYARAAARLLAAPAPQGEPVGAADRDRALGALAAALRLRAHRRRTRRTAALAAAAALVIAVGVASVFMRSGPPGISARIDGGGAVVAGSVVQATAGRAVDVSLSTGTRLRVGRGARLDVVELGQQQRFRLHEGRLLAMVAHLAPGQRFLVTTADTEVEVRGTAFELALVPPRPECGGTSTEVRVLEGLVTVRRAGRDWQVAAGQRWPAGCAPPAVRTSVAERPAPVSPRPRPRIAAAPPASTLSEQNDLFAAAVRARQRGDTREALRQLDDLLIRFPFGPLAESARSERAKLSEAAASAPP